MEHIDPFDFERREALLESWVDVRSRIAALEAEAAALLGERLTLMDAEVAEAPRHRDAIWRSTVAEYSAAGRISKGSMEYAFGDALHLRDLPAVAASFAAGRVTAAHVREIVRAADVVCEAIVNAVVTPETLGLYEEAVLVVAESDSPARTRAHARQTATVLAEQTVRERQERACGERSVTIRSVGDGLVLLSAVLPEYLAVAIHDRLTQLARTVVAARTDASVASQGQAPTHDEADAQTIFGPSDTFTRDPFSDDDALFAEEPFVFIDGTFVSSRELPSLQLRDITPEVGHAGDPLAAVPVSSSGEIDGEIDGNVSADISTESHGDVAADTRTMDQLRADLFADLLLTSDPSAVQGHALDGIRARIQVTVSATTLADLDDQPAHLDGHGPLHPDIARRLAGRHSGWTRLFLNPAGQVTSTDTYTPTEPMKRHLRARDEHCRFTGCQAPATRCDIDHQHDHARGGPTSLDNLAHLCRAHHMLKHPDVPAAHRWLAAQAPDGTITWRSPLGRTYDDHPPRRVMFV